MNEPSLPREPPPPPDCNGDAAAYALGALEPAEAQAYRRHLESCAVCRDELAAFTSVVDALPAAVPQYRAPAQLRRRVRHELRAVQAQANQAQANNRRRRAWPRLSLPLTAAAAMAAAAVVLVIVLSSTGGSSTRVISAQVSGPGSAQVRVSRGQAELVLRNFPAPPAGEVYEVWLRRGASGRPMPTHTLFSVTTRGAADVGVAGRLSGVTQLMVTPERAGGSTVPTHPPVLVARVD